MDHGTDMPMFSRILDSLGIQKSGYWPKNPTTDLILGGVSGVDYVLWGYSVASMIFVGVLSEYLSLGVTVAMVSGAFIAFIVGVTSKHPATVAGIGEQSVAIIATIAILVNARIDEFTGLDSAAATLFVIMAFSSVLFAICFLLAARYNLGLFAQLIPLPVVCGFLGGLGWLFFSATVTLLAGIEVSVPNILDIFDGPALVRWAPAFGCGLAIFVIRYFKDHFLVMPCCLLACLLGFYIIAYFQGYSHEMLSGAGWVFQLGQSGEAKGFADLDFSGVNFGFIGSVMPEIGTLLLINLLSASFALSALELGTGAPLDLNMEMSGLGKANVASGMVMGLPGLVDTGLTITYYRMGAKSRILPLVTAAACLVTAFVGGGVVEYLPKIVIGTLIFLIAIYFIYDWLFIACRQMTAVDSITVWAIFGVIVFVGFIPGVLLGIILTSLLFIVRYSKIEIVGSSFSLDRLSSSVDRPAGATQFLQKYGNQVQIFNLRGFLFFGSASIFYERIKTKCQSQEDFSHFIFDFKGVVGIDSTAAQVFIKVNNLLDSYDIRPVFCNLNPQALQMFKLADVFADKTRLVFDELDLALKWVEENLLETGTEGSGERTIDAILEEIIGDRAKSERLLSIMDRQELEEGDHLFRQGDVDESIFIIESGSFEVRLETPDGKITRLREFRQGTVVGEMAAYTDHKERSASAWAVEPSVVYRLAPEKIRTIAHHAAEYELILHEFIARLLASRLTFMNRRLETGL